MAEIKIEHKKQVWPWVLVGLVIFALLLYFLVFRDNGKNTEAVTEADSITNTNEPDLLAVKEYAKMITTDPFESTHADNREKHT